MPGLSKAAREEQEQLRSEGKKRCSSCREVKALASFSKSSRAWDQLQPHCKACQSSRNSSVMARHRVTWSSGDPYSNPSLKRCADCAQTLARSFFSPSPTRSDGLLAICKECSALRTLATSAAYRSRWTDPNSDPYADPSPKGCGECELLRPRSDYSTDPSKRDGLQWACKGCNASATSERRALILGQFVEHVDRGVLWARDQGICYLCELPADPARWDVEHVHPVSHGGEHSYANTAVSHPSCNYSKGSKPWPDVSWPEGDEILARLSA